MWLFLPGNINNSLLLINVFLIPPFVFVIGKSLQVYIDGNSLVSRMDSQFLEHYCWVLCLVYFLFSAASVVGLPSETFMAVLKRGSAGHDSVAIRVDQKSYSYVQLITSAWNISHFLCSQDLDSEFFFQYMFNARLFIVNFCSSKVNNLFFYWMKKELSILDSHHNGRWLRMLIVGFKWGLVNTDETWAMKYREIDNMIYQKKVK